MKFNIVKNRIIEKTKDGYKINIDVARIVEDIVIVALIIKLLMK